jgi:hypothetical protein
MEINDGAPVRAERTAQVGADAELVWDVLADVERWPAWNADVASVSFDGPLEPGSTFRWRSGGATITSTLQVVDRPRELSWTGKTLGVRAIHTWRLEQRGDATHVRTAESFEGLLARLLRRRLQRVLDTSLESGLDMLAREAERRRAA